MPWYLAPDIAERRNIGNLYVETIWFGVLSGLTATFVPVFALRLGATNAQMGWLTALPALVNIFWILPAARLIERQRRPMPLMLFTGLLQRVGYLLMVAVPALARAVQVPALTGLNTIVAFPTAVINTAVMALIPEVAPADRRGTVVSVRWLLLSTAETLAAVIGGWLLGLMAVPVNYQWVLGAGTVLSLLSLKYLRRIRVADAALARRDRPGAKAEPVSLRSSVHSVLAQRGFVRFSVASFVFYWGLYLPAALWSIIRVRELGATDAWVGLIAMVINVSTIAGYFYWGKIGAKKGDRWLLNISALGVAVYACLTALVPSIEWMIATSALGGLSWAGCNLALFNYMLAVCPSDRRPTYIGLYTALINVTAFFGPLLGAALAGWVGIRVTFGISGAIRLGGLALFVWLMK